MCVSCQHDPSTVRLCPCRVRTLCLCRSRDYIEQLERQIHDLVQAQRVDPASPIDWAVRRTTPPSTLGLHTVDFGSFGSSGLSVRGDDTGLGRLPRDVEGAKMGFMGEERERLEGLRGIVGDIPGLAAGVGGLLPISTS